MTHQLWGGRFATPPAEALDKLNRSLPVDHRLWQEDLRVAGAWVKALTQAGVLSSSEAEQLQGGLAKVASRLPALPLSDLPDEDIHTLVERLLYEEVGAVAGKLNTGRSRNDQVATDLRLWTMGALHAVDAEVVALGKALVAQAETGLDLILPGYTHMQRAQPVRWAYIMTAHAWPLTRDRDRLRDALRRTSEMPLGVAALAGSGIAVDRELLRKELGFERIAPNGLDTTGDRDFVAEALFALALMATHVSRLAGELVVYTSSEYGFVKLDDAWATGSSLLPQKKNPDVFELARAKAAVVLGDLVTLMGTLKGLPAGYSKDLQEDKAALFHAVDTILLVLPAVRGAIETMKPVPQRMAAALDPALFATDIADALVAQGVPFREAHGLTGKLVRAAEQAGVAIPDVNEAVARGIHEALPGILQALGTFADSVERRGTVGGSGKASVMAQSAELRTLLG
ncbi:MAG: argininosuccinate lyase [Gemmatimonadales bacterium]